MDQGLLPRRYAKALYKFALDKNYASRAYVLMENLAAAFDTNPELQQAMANPYLSDKRKTSLLLTACGIDPTNKNDAPIVDFFRLLEDKRRVDIVRHIALAYTSLYRRENNIYSVEITSARELDQADRDRITRMVERHLDGATAQYTWHVDPSLIGGFTVTIDSLRLDASIKNELKQLRLNLLK